MSKQTHLSFTPITADEAAKQRAALAAAFAAEHPAAAAADVPEKRGVGRPKRQLDLALVAQQSNNNNNNDNNDNAKRTRGTYTNWFISPYINDIIAMYNRKLHSARIAVAALRASAPDGRFDHLSHSTIAAWFDENHKLKITYALQLSLKQGAARGHGPPPALKALPAVEREIKDVLKLMRAKGAPLNTRVIRWIIQAIAKDKHPALLDSLALSQQWISKWVRSELNFRWRAATTAAAKLPHDWEDQGILMAKRIAVFMQVNKVSCCNYTFKRAPACPSVPQRAQSCSIVLNRAFSCFDVYFTSTGSSITDHQHGSNWCSFGSSCYS